MPRPPKCRRVSFMPKVLYFIPIGISARVPEEIKLSLDEMEALRLADLEGLYQEDAALRMNISRQTFANILASAHRITAEALVHGKALRVEGGNVEMHERQFVCWTCRHTWQVSTGSGCPSRCPRCSNGDIRRGRPGSEPADCEGSDCKRKKACCRKNSQGG